MLIYGLQKLSLLDYPEKLAATVFTGGCNFRCPFCHNAPLVTRVSECITITEDEFFSFLTSRRGKLDGVCITGGEPLLQADIRDFIVKIRDMGFLIKLDTNGFFPEKLSELLAAGLLDYVAMDFKNSPDKYALTVGIPNFNISPVLKSVKLLMESSVPYEFRTTLVQGLHTESDMEGIGEALRGAKQLYLQNFFDSGDLVGFTDAASSIELAGFDAAQIERFHDILKQYVDNVIIRG